MILRGSVFSRILEMETGITVITPQDYQTGEPYRVAYLLHGLCGSHGNWADYTMLPLYALDCRAVFVMPEAGRSFYADMKYGQRFFTYIADELPMICKRTFNLSASREDTAVMGGSMGGYGALKTAFSRPEQFGCCCAFAPACLYLGEQITALTLAGGEAARESVGEQLVRDFQGILGETFATSRQDRISELACDVPPSSRPRVYACCGSDDDLLGENRRFRDDMARSGFGVTYEEWPGGHDWRFFGEALQRGIAFWTGDTA